MPNWKKIITSGSDAALTSLSVTNAVTATSFTGSLLGTASFARSASFALTAQTLVGSVSTASYVVNTVTGASSTDLVYGNMADNDQFRIRIGGTATNAGFVEIATADDGTEPIHVRQYTGVFSSLTRTATLLDGSGNTTFPGSVTANGTLLTGNTGTVTSVATSGTVSGITLTGGTITTTGTIALGGSISGLTNANLSGTAGITNANLANSSITIGSTATALGATSTTIAGLTSVTSAAFVGALTGNASTVTTNANLTGHVTSVGNATTIAAGVVTNAMLAGSISNANLANSAITIGTTSTSLGASNTTIAGLTSVTSTTFVGALTGNATTATSSSFATTASYVSPTFISASAAASGFGSGGGGGAVTSFTDGVDNRVLTAVTATTIKGEANLTYDGTDLINTIADGYIKATKDADEYVWLRSLGVIYMKRGTSTLTIDGASGGINQTPTITSNVNLNLTATTVAVQGALTGTSDITATGNVIAYSDQSVKDNVTTIPNALEKVQAMRGVTFTRNDQKDKERVHAGVIAQEMEKAFPEVVFENPDGTKGVAYGNIVSVLIEAIKEQQKQIDDLRNQLNSK